MRSAHQILQYFDLGGCLHRGSRPIGFGPAKMEHSGTASMILQTITGSSTLPHNACPASLKRWRDFVRTQCLPVHINSLKLCRQRKSVDCDGGDTVMTKSLRCAMLNL